MWHPPSLNASVLAALVFVLGAVLFLFFLLEFAERCRLYKIVQMFLTGLFDLQGSISPDPYVNCGLLVNFRVNFTFLMHGTDISGT